jgi:putative transposase
MPSPPAMSQKHAPNVPLPKHWKKHVKSTILDVISLAQYATTYTRSWAADSRNACVRLTAEKDRLEQELALLCEELRIKDARMARLPAHRRPQYTPVERMAILELRAARAWSLTQAAEAFWVTAETIASWTKRIDEAGTVALVQTTEPVNKFPDFARTIVRRLKALCPAMGKVKIAETLARAGLHLGVTTVGRILKEKPQPTHEETTGAAATDQTDSTESAETANDMKRVVTAKYPNHVWHVDLTAVSILGGFWTSWLPFALPQCWPFCWWVAVVLDHYSRRMMGFAVFAQQPTSVQVRSLLGRTIHSAGRAPKYLICDKGRQFWCSGFKDWCRRRAIKPRYGAIGQHGSLAAIERFILTIKTHCTRVILVPTRRDKMREELNRFAEWYNDSRPHMTLKGSTPDEVYQGRHPTCRYPRLEPRARWPRGAPCAKPACPSVASRASGWN